MMKTKSNFFTYKYLSQMFLLIDYLHMNLVFIFTAKIQRAKLNCKMIFTVLGPKLILVFGLVKFVPAVAYHFCLNLPAEF